MALVRAGAAEDVVTAVRDVLAQAGEHASAVGVSGPVPPALAADALVQARQASHSARQERTSVGWYDRMALGAVLSDAAARARVRALHPGLAGTPHGGRGRRRRPAPLAPGLPRPQRVVGDGGAGPGGAPPHAAQPDVARRAGSLGSVSTSPTSRVVLYLALATRDDA